MAPKTKPRQRSANNQPVKKPDSLQRNYGEIKPTVRASKAIRAIVTKEWKTNPTARGKPKNMKGLRPLGGLQVYQPVDPYRSNQRNLFRIIMKMVPQINRANKLIQKLVATEYTTSVLPRLDKEIHDNALDLWRKKRIPIPYVVSRENEDLQGLEPQMSPNEVKEWIDRLFVKLKLQELTYNSYLFRREQGRCVVGMFPETRDELGQWQIPQAMRLIRPDYTMRPIINYNTGNLEGIEIIGLSTNGGRLDARRAIYFVNQDNLDLFADFYGVSEIEPLVDVGESLLGIYAKDIKEIVMHTWWQPKIFKMTIPARNADNPNAIMDEFLVNMRDAGGKDIVLTQTVELVSGTGTSNSGDVNGIVNLIKECIDAILGFYNIPPFLLGRGEVGNLGGNANQEEMDAFLNIEIRPEQVDLENTIEKQCYDIILAILFEVEPNEVNEDSVPIKMEHHFKKPNVAAAVNLEQYEIIKDLATTHELDDEKVMDRLGLTELLKINPIGKPVTRTWEKSNPNWNRKPSANKFAPSKKQIPLPQNKIQITK